MSDALKERWLDRLTIEANGCWTHSNCPTPRGYQRMRFQGRSQPSHRVMYELLVAPIPAGLEIDHLCRNRGCLNPSHMEPVTQAENLRRGESFSASNARKTHCPRGHLYDRLIPRRDGRFARGCRTCQREQMRELRRKKREE